MTCDDSNNNNKILFKKQQQIIELLKFNLQKLAQYISLRDIINDETLIKKKLHVIPWIKLNKKPINSDRHMHWHCLIYIFGSMHGWLHRADLTLPFIVWPDSNFMHAFKPMVQQCNFSSITHNTEFINILSHSSPASRLQFLSPMHYHESSPAQRMSPGCAVVLCVAPPHLMLHTMKGCSVLFVCEAWYLC